MRKIFILLGLLLGIAFPSVSLAADNASGYLIKGSRPAVYFYSQSTGKRYVFPNEKTYKTWYENYDSVRVISDVDLAKIQLGGNVVYRPGTKLVKVTSSPTVYVIGHNGYLHPISDEALARKLYGNDWAKKVSDIPDAFFTNYKIGLPLTTPTYVDGTLIHYANDLNTYLIKNGKKSLYDPGLVSQDHVNLSFVQNCPLDIQFETGETLFQGNLYYGDVAQISIVSTGKIHNQASTPTPTPVTAIPNVEILEFAANDPCRQSTGAVRGDCIVDAFYENNSNDYDMLVMIDLGPYGDKQGFWSGWGVHRYVPYNIGQDKPDNMVNVNYPSRLRYMQQVNTSWQWSNSINFIHEVGHYWSIGWVAWDLSCYTDPLIDYFFENGHWTELFQASDAVNGSSVMSYVLNSVTPGEPSGIPYGTIIDNHNNTFSFKTAQNSLLRFNYMDLYAMGLLTESELAQKEMFVLIQPKAVAGQFDLFTGTRRTLTLADFKDLLQQKEDCDGIDYLTGDGSRRLHAYDQGRELARNFNIGIVLLKYPEQEISKVDAHQICQQVNYNWIRDWNFATYGMSNISTNLGDGINPDCSVFLR